MRIAQLQRRRGFTLIELMLAMALGMVIVFTAFAGIRVAGQCYTISTKLSLENSLLRTGFMKALDELDFWTSYDDPFDSSMTTGAYNGGEVLRKPGLPFCPFQSSFPAKSSDGGWAGMGWTVNPFAGPTPLAQTDGCTYAYINENSVTGWHPEFYWPMSDPAVWCRLNMGEAWTTSDCRFGFYGQFSGTYSTFPPAAIPTYKNNHYTPDYTPLPPMVPHQWLSKQMDALKNALGYYGMIEYLPANTIYAYNDGTASSNIDGMSREMSQSGGQFADGDGGTQFPRGLYRDNKDVSFGIFPTNPVVMFSPWNGSAGFNSGLYGLLRQYFQTGQYTSVAAMQQFQNYSMTNTPLMTAAPSTWPGVSTSVERFVTYDRFTAVMRVKMTDATSGQHIEFNFSGFGTSLRGARQQRKLNKSKGGPPVAGQGWAWYDNDTSPYTTGIATPSGQTVDDTLDTQQ
jgi:prepilin-type N-terminal cleavage/methylation domain-containing protein